MEYIDGHPVVQHRVRFTQRAEISEPDAEHVKDGATIVWVVQAVCQPPSYHPAAKSSEDRYRFNVQRVERAAVLVGDAAEQALAYLADPSQTQGYLRFTEAPRHPEGGNGVHHPAEDKLPFTDLPLDDEDEPYTFDPSGPLLDDGQVEVVGSIYRSGHESETQRLLRENWGGT